jgi:integrase
MLPNPSKFLTSKALAAIRAATDGRTHFIPDGAVGGLGVLVGATGRPAWTLAYRVNGKQIRVKLGFAWGGADDMAPPGWLGLEAARVEAYRIKKAARRGEALAPPAAPVTAPRAPAVTLEGAIDAYLTAKAPKKRGEVERLLAYDLAPLMPKALSSITRSDTRAAIDAIVARGAKVTANRVYQHLRAVLRWAVKRELIKDAPIDPADVSLHEEKSRERVLTDDELLQVWRATADRPAPLRAIVRLLILTGARREEVARMRWADLDGASWAIPGDETKNEQPHIVPLAPAAFAIIAEIPRIAGCPWVFSNNGRSPVNMSKEGGELQQRTFAGWQLHDLRRTCATGMARLGVDEKIADRCLNHVEKRKAGIAQIYNQFQYLDARRAAMLAWADHVASLARQSDAALTH